MCNADDAAVLIQVMRDKPELMKTSFGMDAHRLALKKIKGTHWEETLFPRTLSLDDARQIKAIRGAYDDDGGAA